MTQSQSKSEAVPTDMPAAALVQTRPQTPFPIDTPQTDRAEVGTSSHPTFNDEGASAQTRPQTPFPVGTPQTDKAGAVSSSHSTFNDEGTPAQTRPQTPFPENAPTPDPVNAAASGIVTVRQGVQQGITTATASQAPASQSLPDQVKAAEPENILTPNRLGFFDKWLLPALQPIHTAVRRRWQQLADRWHHWRDTRQGPEQARQWLRSLDWYRLRYQTAPLTKQGLQVLAGDTGCGRVALLHTLYPWPHLYLGLPPQEGGWARQVANDYQFHLQPVPAPDALLTLRLQPADGLEWQRPFLTHLVGDRLFVMYQDAAAPHTGQFWPGEREGQAGRNWQLPHKPPFGLTTRPQLAPVEIPKAMHIAGKPDGSRWLLGHAPDGTVFQAATPQVRVVGNEAAVTLWLEQAALASLALQPVGLVILDGEGTLTHRLRRHALVNELLHRKQLTLASITEAGDSRIGFNPLARVPGESEAHTVSRWQGWFAGMGCSWQSRALLLEAYREGITELNQLHRWLEQPARLGQHANALLSLKTALHRLITAATVRDWLEWPTNLFAHLADRAVLFACPGSAAWEKQQLLQAMLLGVQAAGQARLILTGTGEIPIVLAPEMRVLAGNGMPLLGATQVVTTLDNVEMARLDNLAPSQQETMLQELIPLLGPGEGVVLLEAGGLRLAW